MAYPDEGAGDNSGESIVFLRVCNGDSEGEGKGSTAPDGGG